MKTDPLRRHTIRTSRRQQVVDATDLVRTHVRESRISSGMVLCHVPHTTAGICVNENADPDVKHDVLAKLEQLAPYHEAFYQHGEGNSDAHVKAIMTGCGLTLLVEAGDLLLGTWQGIWFCEFDGPRTRNLVTRVVGFD